jgi:signal transduction histidine kinase
MKNFIYYSIKYVIFFFFLLYTSLVFSQTYQQKYDSLCNRPLYHISQQEFYTIKLNKLDLSQYIPGIDTNRCRNIYNKIINYATKNSDSLFAAKAQYYFAKKLISENEFIQSKELLKNALNFNKNTNVTLDINIMDKLALVYLKTGETDSAYLILQDNLKQAEKSNIQQNILTAKYGIANYFVKKKEYIKALEILYQCSALAKETKNLQKQADIQNLIGWIMYKKNNTNEAIEYYYNSKRNNKNLGNLSGLCANCINLGLIQFQLKNFDDALNNYKEALNLSSQTKYLNAEIASYIFIGEIYSEKGEHDLAVKYLTQAVNICKQINMKSYLGEAYIYLSKEYIKAGDYTSSKEFLDKADTINNDIKNSQHSTESKIVLAELYIKEHKLREAEQTLTNISDIKDPDQNLQIHTLLAEIYTNEKRYKEALFHKKIQKSINDSILNNNARQKLLSLTLQQKFEKEKERIQLENQITAKQKNNKIENQKIILIVSIIIGILMFSFLIFFFSLQKHKKKIRQKKLEKIIVNNEISQLERILEGEEQERIRISQELHDGISGELAIVKYGLEITIQKTSNNVKDIVTKLSKEIDTILQTVRNTSFIFSSPTFEETNLSETIEIFCNRFSMLDKTIIEFQSFGKEPSIIKKRKIAIYRIIQELINNILIHANATNALVQIIYHPDKMHLTIEDNGVGFNIKTTQKGRGLLSILSRIEFLNALYQIDSSSNGTTFIIEVPI